MAEAEHPPPCPWCGKDRIRHIGPAPEGERWYRCDSCLKTFHIRAVLLPPPATPPDQHADADRARHANTLHLTCPLCHRPAVTVLSVAAAFNTITVQCTGCLQESTLPYPPHDSDDDRG